MTLIFYFYYFLGSTLVPHLLFEFLFPASKVIMDRGGSQDMDASKLSSLSK